MSTIIRKIGMGWGKTLVPPLSGIAKAARGAALPLLIAASAILPARGDDLAITPAEIPAATQQVYYAQTFTASGASGGLSWSTVAWKVESAASTYAVGASETPLWDGAQTFYTNIVYTLPFAFPYRDQSFTNLYISAGGILFFTSGRSAFDYSVGYYYYLYNALVPFWMEEAENVEGYVDTSVANEVSFRFAADYTNASEVACKFAYRVTLKSDGTIRYSYRQDAGDTIGDSVRAVGLSYYDTVHSSRATLPVGEESDGIPTCDYVFTTYTGYPDGFTFQGNYDYSSDLYYPTATLSGQTSEFGTWTFGVSVYDAGTSTATTNYYTLTVAENPDKPPVFDAFTPADTNTARALAIGDTLNFHVEASDPKGGPFDITWTFLDADVESPVKRTLGTGADLTFVASNELYEIQRWGGSSVVKCTISDAYWTNSITWHVYISKEFYLDPAADPGAADGSAAHPWATIPEPGFTLRKGDTLNLVPGVYVIDDDSLGFPGGVTIRTTGSSADTKIVYPDGDGFFQGQNDHLKIANITVEGIRFQNADLEDCTIIGVQSPSYCFDDCSFTRCYVTGNSTTKEYLFRDSTLEDCTVAGNTIGYSASDDYFTGYTAIGPYCQLVRSIVVNNLTLDGDEANWVDQEYWGIAATNCCTIPAMTDYGPGNIEAQPTFVSLEGYDARLRVGSACIDADDTANNVGAYKGPGVEGFAVLATTDPVRGTVAFSGDVDFKSAHATHIVASGGSVTVTATAVTNRVFKNWIVNGEEGATTPTLTLNDITADMEVEAVFEVKEFYVNPTVADDSGDGSAAAPKKTAAAAAALALDGETIRLAEGSYEPFALLESSKVTLLGAGPDKTFIDGGGTNWCVRLGSNATLKNVAVVNGKYTSWSSYAGGVTGGTIENCVVSNCVSTQTAGGVYNATVVSSLIVNNVNTNTSYNYAGYPAGVGNCEVYNSTIANNISSGYPGGVSDSYLKNCIVYGNTAKVGWTEYNEVSSCDGDGDIYDTNLIGSDPWFVNAANGDYRLIAGSPAIDAGEDVPEFDFAHMTDLAGDRRIRGTAVDYGCYEGGVVTAKPAAPVATGTSAKAAKGLPFTWEAVPNAAQYRIYRGTSDNVASATLIGTTTATSYLDLATTGGTDYFYWVSSYNATYGESEKCGPIVVTSYAELKIETASLPAATEAVPYSVQLECSGNVGAATWSLPYAFYTRETCTFDGSVGEPINDSGYEIIRRYGQTNAVVSLPFAVNWFGVEYTKMTMSNWGGLYFGEVRDVSWGSWSMYGDGPKIAVLEGINRYTITPESEMRVDVQPDHVTFVWRGYYYDHGRSATCECSATVYSDSTFRLSYGDGNKYGGYIGYSNGTRETIIAILSKEHDGDYNYIDCGHMDDILITSLPNDSGLTVSEDGLLTGIIDFAGNYKVSALVTDAANGDTVHKTFTLTVNANANTRPVIDSTSPATGGSSAPEDIARVVIPAGDSQAFSVAARDPEGAALNYSWFLDDNLVSSGSSWTFATTDADLGRHTLVCEVADALWTNGQVYAEWDISVGQKLYVNAVTGTTNGTGTAESPFKTLQQAEEWLSMGATVLVAPGTYAPVRLWGWTDASVVFRATGSAAETIIDGGGSNVCVDDWNCTKEFTFIGFTLRNGGDTGVTGGATGTASYGVNLKDCVITGCTGGRCTIYGADVENCQIYGNTATRYGAAVGFCNVVNSLIYGNTAGGTGVVYRSTLDHCTVYGNTAMVGGGLDATSTADHSIVWGNTATADASTANYQPGTNDVQFTASCTTPLPAGGEGNIAQNPQFVDAAGGDFRLADSSPCKDLDMGYSATGVVPVGTTYTVTFDANGGTPATTTRTVAKGKAVGTLPQATRAGYTLKGWYTAKTGGSQFTATATVTKDITLYAQWTETPKYTVTFDANGGTCATKTLKVEQGAAIGELPEATRDGYTLAGWFTAKTGGSQFTATDTITKNITLYARWTEYYELVIDENGVLTGLTGTTPATIDVPATVTAFAADLFKGVTKITSATGGANVTKCGAGAFRDSGIWKAAPNGPVVVCGVLVGYKGTVPATVDVPAGVRVIADGAFAGATSLATVYLPDSLVSIGDGAFKNCAKLDDVFGLESGVTVAADAFEGTLHANFRLTYDSSGTTVTGFKGPLPAALVLPAKVIGVGVGAFKDQATLTSLVIEGTNTVNLGSSAFEGCANLATVTIGGSPTIAATTFKDCTALQTLTAGGSASIAASAFQTCTALKTFTAGGGATVGASAFEDCTTLETFTAGDTVSIATNAFKGCVALANTDFGEVSELGAGAFEGCSLLASLELAEGIEEIGAATFKDCASLGQINLPASVTTIGASAFEGCTNLVTITGGDNVRILRTDAFAGTAWYDTAPAGTFEEVILGHVLLRVKGDVPASYEISTNVTMVANNAFAGVTTLTNLYIGTEVVSLWDRAFAGCTSLGSVTIPSGCREFGDHLFDGCSSLSKVFFRGHAPTNDVPHVFAGTPETLKVHIKEGSRGWEYPGADSDYRPARWPYQTTAGRYGWQRVANDLNRAVYDPDDEPGVVRSVIVGGNITNDTTWVGGRVYEVQSTCTVREGATLTIEEGAIVKMQRHQTETFFGWFVGSSDMRVEGHLQINGTKANPVVFTSSTDDTWGGDTNGDGNRSEPYPGECSGVKVQGSGSVEARYAKFLYGNAANAYNAHACVMDYGYGSYYYGCEFSHSAMDGFFGGGRLENCVFTDCDRGIVSTDKDIAAVNCVAYGNRVGFWSHTSCMYITNCISAFNSEYGITGDGMRVYSTRCCLWNPDGQNSNLRGSQYYKLEVENIEADPLFLDAENGDFRISVESPCVDAAWGDVAPEYDSYEQPRMDVKYVRNTGKPNAAGEYPDIGIYEVPGTTERPVMNLEVESVSFAPASAAPGETLTVTYTVRNTGNTAAKGSIRDVVRIKSAANGGTMTAGTVTQNYNLQAAETAALHATVTMPAAPAGEWLVGIDVNPNRDVFEQNFLKNSMWTEDAVEVRLPAMSAGADATGATLPAGTTAGYMLKDVPEEGGIVVITAAGTAALPVIARVATGHMPTAAMNDATSFVRADGSVVLVVPPHAAGEAVYLAIENTGVESVTLNSQLTTLNLDLWSVYPETAANVGDMGFTFTGAGLTAESEFYLGGIKAKSVSVIDSANVYAVFDVQNIAADRYYDVSADGKTIRDAVYINKKAKGPILEAKLELPERTRDNRIYTGYVVYENKGDTQMNAPTFIINIAEAASTNTVIGAYDDDDENLTQQRVLIVGLGSSHPAGILKPGDSGRLPFKFKPVGSYQFKLDSRYTSDEVAGAVTRMNLRGAVKFDGYAARGLASLIKKGEEAAAVSGWLLDSRTREPLANAALKLTLKDTTNSNSNSNSFARVVTTDDDGYFSFEQLKDGVYTLVADKGYALATTNAITVAGQADVNGYEATAVPPGVVSGYVMGDDGTVVQYGEVALFRSASDMVGETVRTDGFGAYRFTGLEDGEYSVYARPYEAFKGQLATNLVVSTAARERRLDFALRKTSRAFGTVTAWKGGTVEGGEVRFYQEDGGFLKVDVSTNGTWEAAGVEPGKYSVAYISTDGRYDSANASVSLAAGDVTEIQLVSQPATPFRTSTTFGVIDANRPTLTVYFAATGYANDTNIASVVWRFGDEGGKTYETNSVEIAHDYKSVGEFTVSTQPRYVDGTLGDEFEIENCIMVTNELETIYKDNAIVLGGYMPDDANFKTNAGTLAVVGVGDDWVKLTGSPGDVALEAGTVIAGSYKDTNNEDDWFLRRIVGVTGDATSGWTLTTEHGNEADLYVQYWSYWSDGVQEQKQSPQLHSARPRLMSFGEDAKNLLKKVSGSIEKGIEFDVECSPDLHYHYSCTILTSYWRKVVKTIRREEFTVWELYSPVRRELSIFGDVSIKADITATASFGGSWDDEQEYDLVPTAYKTIPSAAKAYPYFKIGYAASGSIEGSVSASAEIKGYLDIGFVKEDEKDIVWHKSKPFTGDVDISFNAQEGIDANIKLEASVSAGLGVKVKAFEVVTAKADVTFNAKASVECPKNSPSKAGVSIGYDTNVSMNFIDLTWLNKNWKVGMDWTIEGLTLWSQEWISAKPNFIYRQPHAKEWPARITVTDRSERGTYADARGRTFPIPIRSVDWDYGQGQTFHYGQAQIESGEYKKHRIIEFPGDQEEGEYTVSLNVQGGIAPSLWPCQKKIKIKKPEEDEQEEQTKIYKDEWFGPHQSTQKSVDPNEMAGPEGVGEQRYVKPGQEMTYTIFFENKADAAIAAQEVFVDNALSEYLDWSTFRMGTVSVGGQIISGLDGYMADEIAAATEAGLPLASEIDQTNGLYKTRAEVMFDAGTGVASWYIRVVDPAKRKAGELLTWPNDDTAGVLQPNLLPPDGEGYITYTVNVSSNAPAFAVIDNSADIVFDKNPVIVTDPAWWNTVAGNDVGFVDAELEVDEGGNVEVKVNGGNIDKASSVQLYLTYNTAASADLDLAKGTIDGEMPKGGLKFPLTLSWAKGEIGEKVITIPTKTDKTVEGDEFFTLQLAAPNGLTLGDGRVYTVTIHDKTVAAGKQTLQDAVNNAVVKMSTSGKGKWVYSNVGTGGEVEPGKTASASAVSPVLKVGEASELKAAAVKGSGTLSFDVRVANPDLEGESPEAADGAAKTVLTLLDGKTVLLAWTNETDWTSASYTVKEEKATSHAFTWQVVQGVDTNARAYVANVAWSPVDTDMRAITLAVEPAEGGMVAGSGVYPDKTKLSLVATAKVGYEFIGWYDGEMLFDAKAKPSVTITNDLALTARFEKIPYVRGLADPADGGKVTGSGLCARGKKVTLKAAANKNFTFLGWRKGTGNGSGGSQSSATEEYVATTASLVIDRSAKPTANSKTSTTITNIAEDVTYFAVFKSYPEVFVTVDSTDGVGAEPTGKGAGKYVAGTITGMGKYAPGKTKIALKAAANKGYVFAGWYDANGELLTKEATYTIASMGENDVEYTAKFVTSEEDKAAITLEVNGEALDTQNAIPAWSNYCGVAVSWPVTSGGLSETKVKVSGLPSGLKFTDKPVTSKIGSGKSAVTVTNVPANTIYGAPTAASKADKNTGLLTPAKVKFTVTTAGKSTETFTVDVVVLPLPDWAVGTFDGAVSEGNGEQGTGNGTVAITIAANGKISGKILESGKTWALTAASFSAVEGQLSDVDNLTFRATVIGTAGKEVATNEVTVTAGTRDACPYLSGVVSGCPASEPAGEPAWKAYQNLWKRADTKAEQPVIKKDIKVDHELVEGDANNKLTLTFKKDGAVAFAGKVDGAKVSGSSQLVNDGEGWKVTLYAPAKGTFAGFCKTLVVALTLDAPNIVKDVAIGGDDASAGSGSWFTGEFNGYGDAQFPVGGDTEFLNGLFTVNVASSLAFTGTFTGTDGSTASFSGTFAKDGSSYVANGVSIMVKGATMSMTLSCDPGPYAGSDEGFGEMGGGSSAGPGEPCIALNCAWQNIWKRSDLAAEWKPAFATGTEKTIDLSETWLDGLVVGDSLTYAFGAEGSVSITGKICGENVSVTAKLHLEGCDSSTDTMHCNVQFIANGHLYQQQFTFPRQATVAAADISLSASDFTRLD